MNPTDASAGDGQSGGAGSEPARRTRGHLGNAAARGEPVAYA